MSKKQIKEEYHLGENDLTAWIEAKLGHLKPYASQITLVAALIFAAFVGIAYFVNYRQTVYADQWRELNLANHNFRLNGNTTSLLEVAEDYPNQKAGMWSLQMAGDSELRTGISQLSYAREDGLKFIKRAKENLQRVVDAPSAIKSSDLQRRSLFSLAYACESLGQFDEAKQHYQRLVDEAPDSAFAEPARRGVSRCSNPDMIALYETFKNWKDLADDAPGPNVPTIPNIEFPDIDVAPTSDAPQSGGNFDTDSPAAATPRATVVDNRRNARAAATPRPAGTGREEVAGTPGPEAPRVRRR